LRDSHIWILYTRELRMAVRERAIVVNGILMPIFLYPVMLWVMFSGLTLVQGLNEGFTSRVVIQGEVPEVHRELMDSLAAPDEVLVYGWEPAADEGVEGDEEGVAGQELPSDQPGWTPLMGLQNGDIDAILSFSEVNGASVLPDNFTALVRFDRSEARSRSARDRIDEAVNDYRDRWIAREAGDLGIDDATRVGFGFTTDNVSSEEELGAMILGQMLSLFLVIMVALGCFMPSVDTTAGERERSTWETTMTLAASRQDIVVAKYLYVATLGILAGLLNVIAMFLSIGAVLKPLLAGNESFSFSMPLLAVPVMMMGAVVLALFFSAAMMILASFARTFKDGQAMVTPVYWLVFLPMLLGNQTDLTLSPTVAMIPVANVAMMIRDALNGVFMWPLMGLSVAVNLALVAVLLVVARRVLVFEDFLMGSFDGSFWRFMKDRMMGKKSKNTAPEGVHHA